MRIQALQSIVIAIDLQGGGWQPVVAVAAWR